MGGLHRSRGRDPSAEAFERLVLVSAAGISHSQMLSGPAATAARMAVVVTPFVLRMRDKALLRPGLRLRTFGGVFHNPLQAPNRAAGGVRERRRDRGFLPAMRGLVGYDFLDHLEDVELPALIVWGRNDRIVPPPTRRATATACATRERSSTTTGHCPMAERPVRFNRELEEFLDG